MGMGTLMHTLDYKVLLGQCRSLKALKEGRQVHALIIRKGHEQVTFLGNLIVHMYSKCGSPQEARCCFERLEVRNVYSWSIMVAAYVDNGQGREALNVFQHMLKEDITPNEATLVSTLSACCGEQFLAEVYSQHGHGEEALQVFQHMLLDGILPNKVTYLSLFDACAVMADIGSASRLHAIFIMDEDAWDLMADNAIINMYGKCGSLEHARNLFKVMPQRNVISWSTLIGVCAQQENGKQALELFCEMHRGGYDPDRITFVSVLDACAVSAALAKGKARHLYVIEKAFDGDVIVGTALVNMYAKCGRLFDAQFMFERMTTRNVVSWNALISAYAQHGHSSLALQLYRQMKSEGFVPTKVTFFAVLSACSFAGLLNEGRNYFDSMTRDYGITPEVVHYNCMIDLLGRAGRLEEAENLIRKMPCEPSPSSWMTLLSACRVPRDVERAERAARKFAQMDPENGAPFVMLSNIYAACGRWEDVVNVRKMIKDKGLKRQPGRSSIEIGGKVQEFCVADMSHPRTDEIYAELDRLNSEMVEAGYAPDTKVVLHDVDESTKQQLLCHHSEKLALAYGLISTPPRTPICIIKNLRVCPDCHSAFKFISKLTEREIVVRDANRFHTIKHGVCSCADYW